MKNELICTDEKTIKTTRYSHFYPTYIQIPITEFTDTEDNFREFYKLYSMFEAYIDIVSHYMRYEKEKIKEVYNKIVTFAKTSNKEYMVFICLELNEYLNEYLQQFIVYNPYEDIYYRLLDMNVSYDPEEDEYDFSLFVREDK